MTNVPLNRDILSWWAASGWKYTQTGQYSGWFNDPPVTPTGRISRIYEVEGELSLIEDSLGRANGKGNPGFGERVAASGAATVSGETQCDGKLWEKVNISGNTVESWEDAQETVTFSYLLDQEEAPDDPQLLATSLPLVPVSGVETIYDPGQAGEQAQQQVDGTVGSLTSTTTLPAMPGVVTYSMMPANPDDPYETYSVSLTPTKWRPALIRVWLNVFIGNDAPGVQPMPGHPGLTWIKNPLPYKDPATGDYISFFGTDQRGFSPSETASSRVHAAFTLWMGLAQYDFDLNPGTGDWDNRLLDVVISTSETLGYGFGGNVLLNGATDVSRCKISNLQWFDGTDTPGYYEVDVLIQASDPLVFLAPDVDVKGTIRFALNGDDAVYVSFSGDVEPWPSFEMYAQDIDFAGQPVVPIFQQGPQPGTGPTSLIGNANVQVQNATGKLTSTGP